MKHLIDLLVEGRRLHCAPVISAKESQRWHKAVDKVLGDLAPEDRWDAPERAQRRERVAKLLAESTVRE